MPDIKVGKILFFLGLAALVYLMIKGYSRTKHESHGRPAEDMVACAHCGVNLPRSEAIVTGGHHFCCEEHRRAGPR